MLLLVCRVLLCSGYGSGVALIEYIHPRLFFRNYMVGDGHDPRYGNEPARVPKVLGKFMG